MSTSVTASHLLELLHQSAGKFDLQVFPSSSATALRVGASPEHSFQLAMNDTAAGLDGASGKSAELRAGIEQWMKTAAGRLKNSLPAMLVTLEGLPVSFNDFDWPFRRSTSGADTYVVHGLVKLEDSGPLHAKVSAALTLTMADVLPAMEQPYAEDLVYNAIRKTLDLGQIELLKSGNRQPVPVSTRFYSFREKRFIITETNETQQKQLLKAKTFWLSGELPGQRLGGRKPVWVADPCDAMYMDTITAQLKRLADELAKDGYLTLDVSGEYATATDRLMSERAAFHGRKDAAVAALKPAFNEDMREGKTNM